jgi:hypothetical protein
LIFLAAKTEFQIPTAPPSFILRKSDCSQQGLFATQIRRNSQQQQQRQQSW